MHSFCVSTLFRHVSNKLTTFLRRIGVLLIEKAYSTSFVILYFNLFQLKP